jgi:hypothetical protein
MGNWEEERWYARYRLGQTFERMGNFDAAILAYLVAYQSRPIRAEPLYELARMNRTKGNVHLAYMFCITAKKIPYPTEDVLFINKLVYEYLLDLELSIIGPFVNHPDTDKLFISLYNKNTGVNFDQMMSSYKNIYKPIQYQKICFPSSTPCGIAKTSQYEYTLFTRCLKSGTITANVVTKEKFKIVKKTKIAKQSSIEDIKIFQTEGSIWFTGMLNQKHVIGKCGLNYSFAQPTHLYDCVVFSENGENLKFVYDWDEFKTRDMSQVCKNHSTPFIFKMFKNASNGYTQGDCIWFVCKAGNTHYHIIVIYNYKTNVFVYTVPFTFEKSTEIVCGLIVEDKTVILLYSTGDNTSNIAVIDKQTICKMFIN